MMFFSCFLKLSTNEVSDLLQQVRVLQIFICRNFGSKKVGTCEHMDAGLIFKKLRMFVDFGDPQTLTGRGLLYKVLAAF